MRILNYNIEYGGFEKNIDYMKYVKLIQKHDIDIFVGIEPNLPMLNDTYKKDGKICANYNIYGENTIEKVAKELGFFYITTSNRSATIISKYKLERTNIGFVFDVVTPECRIKIIPIHLVDYPFTFYSLRNVQYQYTPSTFKNKQDVINLSYSTKSTEIEAIVAFIKQNSNEKIIIVGDFNEPSHLDDVYEWIISKKFEDIGLIDSYRSINKNIILDKLGYNIDGATCCNLLDNDEPPNRVDYIYIKNLTIKKSYLLKEYSHYSDHLPLLTEVNIINNKSYGYKYNKYYFLKKDSTYVH